MRGQPLWCLQSLSASTSSNEMHHQYDYRQRTRNDFCYCHFLAAVLFINNCKTLSLRDSACKGQMYKTADIILLCHSQDAGPFPY